MLSVFFGNDVSLVRKNAFDFMRTHMDVDTLVTHITTDQYREGVLVDLAGGSSLFGVTQMILIDTPSEDTFVFDAVMEGLALMKESSNNFVLIEGSLLAASKKKIEAHATHIEESTLAKTEKFNAFALTDAFLLRDKKKLWLLLQEGEKEGLSGEQAIGLLFWQIKTLRLVEKTSSAEEAGQKPFVYSKAKRALTSFKKGELDTLSRDLLKIYHDGHLGKQDISFALEQWVLKL
jgi:hypothetical protein